MYKYAIICTGSWGDIINTTPLAAHIKTVRPTDEIHWWVASFYESALKNNPYVDHIHIIPTTDKPSSLGAATEAAKAEVKRIGGFNNVFIPAPYMNRYWGEQQTHIVDCIKRACLDAEPGIKWQVPWIPVLNLLDNEAQRANQWWAKHCNGRKLAIFEFDSLSGQSQLRESWLAPICNAFGPGWVVALSGRTAPKNLPGNAAFAGDLTVRETAQLFHHASFMVGVSSGISAACSSTWTRGKSIPWIEICNNMLWSGSIYQHMPRSIYTGNDVKTVVELIKAQLPGG